MKILVFVLVALAGFTASQLVNNVNIIGHVRYMRSIIQEVVSELEQREWCNLKVPDFTIPVNATVLEREYKGSVTYSNGFVASMQWIDIRQSGVDQNWAWNATTEHATVHLRGTLRMLDLALGYDVLTDLEDEQDRYTVAVTYPLVSFTFNIWKNVHTEEVEVGVVGEITSRATINTIRFLPADNTTDVLTSLFDFVQPGDGILAWAENVFPALALNAYNKIELPRICYDCPLATAVEMY